MTRQRETPASWERFVPRPSRLERLADWALRHGALLSSVFGATFRAKTRSSTVKVGQGERALRVLSVGNSHIDAAWMWRAVDTRDKKINVTFSRALHHLRKYPSFTFSQNQVIYYQWARDHYPDIFSSISEYVKEGRWDVTGGDWVEMDVNIPCGESLVRQRLYGQHWLLANLGLLAEVAWYDDVFGFPPTLPQILAKSGAKYFWTNKFCYNDTNRFPLHTFVWRGLDGSEVFSHWIQHKNNFGKYLADFEKYSPRLPAGHGVVLDYSSDFREFRASLDGNFVPVLGNFYGTGDGGNGPTPREVVEQLAWEREGLVELGTTARLFELLEPLREQVPVWADELYLENHRGTLTSVHMVKENNRTAEVLLMQVEAVATLSYLSGGANLQADVRECWLRVLFNQFHDVLPGSSIVEVYKDAARDYGWVYDWVGRAFREVVGATAGGNGGGAANERGIVCLNGLTWPRGGIVVVRDEEGGGAEPTGGVTVLSRPGSGGTNQEFPLQRTRTHPFARNRVVSLGVEPPTGEDYLRGSTFDREFNDWLAPRETFWVGVLPGAAGIQGLGATYFEIRRGNASESGILGAREEGEFTEIHNDLLSVAIDRRSGAITRVEVGAGAGTGLDGPQAESCVGPRGIRLALYEDSPTQFDAWNLHPKYRERPVPMPPVERVVVEEVGPVKVTTLVELAPLETGTRLAYRASLFRGIQRLYLDIAVDWREEWKLLRFEVDTTLEARRLRCAVPYGFYDRPSKPRTPHELARWEFACQSWAEFRDETKTAGVRSVALLDAGKYGTSVHPSGFGVSLLKAAKFINHTDAATLDDDADEQPEFIDRGFNRVPLALQVEVVGQEVRETWRDALEYNAPLLAWPAPGNGDGNPGESGWVVPKALARPPVEVEGENTWLSVVKVAEDFVEGQDGTMYRPLPGERVVVLRLARLSGEPGRATVKFGFPAANIKMARETDLLERFLPGIHPLEPEDRDGLATLDLHLGPFEVKTLLVVLENAPI
ncbi:MAG: alpha-mannosidase [Promethearchaeota archaeon]